MPGIEDFLGLLKKENIPAAIGTSGPEENVSFILDEFNWRNVFHSLVHRSRFKKGKPAPDCFLVAAEKLGQPPDKTIVFEDSVHGLMAANSGGFTAAAIASTHEPAELTQYTSWVFRDFRSLSC
jgi:beta-phosphoglucomutase